VAFFCSSTMSGPILPFCYSQTLGSAIYDYTAGDSHLLHHTCILPACMELPPFCYLLIVTCIVLCSLYLLFVYGPVRKCMTSPVTIFRESATILHFILKYGGDR